MSSITPTSREVACVAVARACEAQKLVCISTALLGASTLNLIASVIPSYSVYAFSDPGVACSFADPSDIMCSSSSGTTYRISESSNHLAGAVYMELTTALLSCYSLANWSISVLSANDALAHLPAEEKKSILSPYQNLFFVK